jgi:hypothetical protein
MRRNLTGALFLGFVATTVLAQGGLNGKWETDRPTDPLPISGVHRNQTVQLEVTIEGDKASGTLALDGLGGTFYIFQDSKVTGNKVQFRPDSNPTLPMWTIEMVDDNTVTLYRGDLPLVGINVLDRISALGGTSQPVSPVSSAAVNSSAVSSSIRGTTQDPGKARIPGVTVTATNVDTGAKLTTTTNDAGVYRFSGLPQGKYTMTASLSGFNPTTINSLTIGDTEILQDLILEFPTPRASATPTAASCGGNGIAWCALLHRTK